MTDAQSDADRRRQTQEVNERAQKAIADTRELLVQLNLSMDSLEGLVTLRKGTHRAQR